MQPIHNRAQNRLCARAFGFSFAGFSRCKRKKQAADQSNRPQAQIFGREFVAEVPTAAALQYQLYMSRVAEADA